MLGKSEQSVGDGSQAIQARGDVTIIQGLSADQMTAIMVGLANQLSHYQSEAVRTVNERLLEFQTEILEKFADEQSARSEAFRDPDFQHVLHESQKAFARSGDAVLRDTLVDIIARRSLETDRNRLALTLDEAAVRAAMLGPNEFAALSLSYIVKHTVNNGIQDFGEFCKYISSQLMPFVQDISVEYSSYWHIEAQSCGRMDSLVEVSLWNLFNERYGGVLGKGLDKAQWEIKLTKEKLDKVWRYMAPISAQDQKLRPYALNKERWLNYAQPSGLATADLELVWSEFQQTIPSLAEVLSAVTVHVPKIQTLFDAWQKTPLHQLSLNSVGIAIGHANASRLISGFNPPLKEWIT